MLNANFGKEISSLKTKLQNMNIELGNYQTLQKNLAKNFNFGEFRSYIRMNNMSPIERQNSLKILIGQLTSKIYAYFQPVINS